MCILPAAGESGLHATFMYNEPTNLNVSPCQAQWKSLFYVTKQSRDDIWLAAEINSCFQLTGCRNVADGLNKKYTNNIGDVFRREVAAFVALFHTVTKRYALENWRDNWKAFFLTLMYYSFKRLGTLTRGKMTLYLLHPATLEHVVICLDSLVFRGCNWTRLLEQSWVLPPHGAFLHLITRCLLWFYFLWLWIFFFFSYRRHAGPVEVASPPRKNQRQPLETERDRRLGDRQSMSVFSASRLISLRLVRPGRWRCERLLRRFFYQFLQDTLDTLFGILDESSQRYSLKVFDSLVSTFFFVFFGLSQSTITTSTETCGEKEKNSDVTLHSSLNQSRRAHAFTKQRQEIDLWVSASLSLHRVWWWKSLVSCHSQVVVFFYAFEIISENIDRFGQ